MKKQEKNSESLETVTHNTFKENIRRLKKNDPRKIKMIIFIIAILIILIAGIIILKTNLIKKEEGETKKEETTSIDGISYRILDNTEEYIKGVVSLNYSEGIQTIEYSNDLGKNIKLNCNGKEKVAIDKKIKLNQDYIFKITTLNGEKNQTLRIDDSELENYVKINFDNSNIDYDIANIEYNNEDNVTNYYKIGNNNENWIIYTGDINISKMEYTDEDTNTVSLYGRTVDSQGNQIINKKDIAISPEKKRDLDVFEHVKTKGNTLEEYGFSYTASNCESFSFSDHYFLAGHTSENGSYSATFKLTGKVFSEYKAKKMYVGYGYSTGGGGSYVYSKVKIYYKNGESQEFSVNTPIDIENKEIDYVEMTIWRI